MTTVPTRPDLGRAEERAQIHSLAAELYREHRKRLLAIARRNAANPADAEEAIQFALLVFLEKFDPNCSAPPLAWVTLTLKRECWAKRKREHLDRRLPQEGANADAGSPATELPSQTPGTEETIQRAEELADAQRQLAALKPAERRALVLIGAGHSYCEVGEITGYSYTKVNRCASEGRASLRSQAGA